MSVDPRIFRAYDIRGRAHEQLTEEACRLVGQAFGSEVRERTGKEHPVFCVGRDARVHGPDFERALVEGLIESGCHVLLIGQTPSPVNYFTICTQKLDGGIQVTASHNPAHDNGLKLCTADADAFAGEDLQLLHKRIQENRFLKGSGTSLEIDAITPYVDHLAKLFKGVGNGMSVAVDSGNGVAGPVYCDVLRAVGATVTELYTEPIGTFPNHPADPSQWETLRELQGAVQDTGARVGLAFDGDGDRLGLVDERGMIRSADEILLLLAQDHLSRFPGAPVVFTVSNSGVLQTEIASWGGRPVLCKVGHSFVENAMREHNAKIGGEQSGHFFCGEDYFGFDDALVASLRLLKILQSWPGPLSTLFDTFPKVYQSPERRPTVADEEKGNVIDRITKHFQETNDVQTMDGARIEFGDGAWVGIRQSNTSPRISICIEARSPEKLEELEGLILRYLEDFPEIDWND